MLDKKLCWLICITTTCQVQSCQASLCENMPEQSKSVVADINMFAEKQTGIKSNLSMRQPNTDQSPRVKKRFIMKIPWFTCLGTPHVMYDLSKGQCKFTNISFFHLRHNTSPDTTQFCISDEMKTVREIMLLSDTCISKNWDCLVQWKYVIFLCCLIVDAYTEQSIYKVRKSGKET